MPKLLPSQIVSAEQLAQCIQVLEDYAATLRIAHARKHVGLGEEATAALPEAVRAFLEHLDEAERSNPIKIERLGTELRAAALRLPCVHLTLPAPASLAQQLKLAEWFRENISPTILLKFHVRSELAGGMMVRTQKRIYDWSFQGRILAQKAALAEGLKHV
jgi:F0F1-type ATP synthase delta subunit